MPSSIVLDTNIWIDKLIFDDKHIQHIFTAIENNTLQVYVCEKMFEELKRVLHYPQFDKFNINIEKSLEYFNQYSHYKPHPKINFPHKCKDKDDQLFIDFCYSYNINTLISKDMHILKMKKTLNKLGIITNLPQNYFT